MRSPEASGSIKEIKELRSRVAKLERVNRKLAKSKRPDSKLDKDWIEWQRTFDAIEDSVMVLDNEFRIVQANLVTSRLTGKPLKEIIGKTCCQVVHGKDKPPEGCPLRKARSSKCHEEADFYISEKEIWIEASVDPVIDEKGTISGAVHIIKNINDRKKEQEAYHSLVDHSLQGLVIFQEGRIVFANQAMAQITGYSVDEMLALPSEKLQAFVHQEDRELVWSRHKQRLLGKLPPEHYELRGIRKDGSVRWLEINASLVEYQGRPAIQAAYLDITERKNSEQQKQEYIRELQFLSESAAEFFRLTPDRDIYALIAEKIHELNKSSIVAVNIYDEVSDGIRVRALVGLGKYIKAVSQIMGSNPIGRCFPLDNAAREGLGQGKLLKIPGGIYDISPGIPKVVCQAIEKLLNLGDVYAMGLNCEGRLYGSATIFTRNNTCLKNQELIETFMNQAAVAIRRWEADLALRKSEAGLAKAQQIAHIGSWDWDVENQVLFWSDEVYRIFGVQRDFQLTFEGIKAMIHPDDREKNKKFVNELLCTADFADIELRIIRPDTTMRHIYQNAEVWRDEAGNVRRIFGVIQDITERKKAEDALRAAEELFSKAFHANPNAMTISRMADGMIIKVNDMWEKVFGYSRAESIGKTSVELGVWCDLAMRQKAAQQLLGTDSLRNFEVDVRCKTGEVRQVILSGERLEIRGEENLITIIHDITERKKAEEALRESEHRFKTLFECAPDGIYLNDMSGKFVDGNKAAENLVGYKREELIGSDFAEADILPSEEIPKALSGLEKNRNGESTGPEEFTLIHKDGNHVPVEIRTFPVRIGDEILTLGIARDISERKRAEEALRESEERYRSLFEGAEDHIFVLDQDFRYVMVNPSALKAGGFTLEDVVGKGPREVFPEDAEFYLSQYRQTFEIGKPVWFERELRFPDAAHWYSVTLNPIKDAEGRIIALTGISRDITEHKRAEEALKDSEARYRAIIEDQTELICRYLSDGTITFVNEAYCRYFGKEFDELVGSTFYPLIVEEDRIKVQKAIATLSVENPVVKVEERIILPNEEIRWQQWVSRLILDEQNQTKEIQAVGRDITERKRSNEAYRSLVDHSLQGLAIFQDGRVVFANQAMAKITGYSVEEMLASPPEKVRAYVHLEDRKLVWSRHKERLEGKILPERYEIRGIRKDGSVRWLEIDASLVEYRGKPAVQAAYIDITERKQAEEALKRSEHLLKEAQKVAHIGHWELDPKVGVPEWSEEIFHIFGLDPKSDEPSFIDHENHVHPGDWPILHEAVTKTSSDGTPFDIQFRIVRPSGRIRWMHALGTAIKDTNGVVSKLFGTAQDITEYKQAEQALKESEEKYRNLFENAHDVIATFDTKGNITDANKAVEEYGFKREKIIGESLFNYVVERHRSRAIEDFEKLIGGRPVSGEMDVITPKGIFTINYSDNPIICGKDVVGIQAILKDITERKRTEEALRESEQKYRELFENAREAIVIIDMDKRITDANKFIKGYGFSKEDLIGRNYLDFVVEKYKEKAIEDFEKLRRGIPQEGEFRIITPKGIVTVYYRDNPIVRAGSVIGVQSVLTDITERKRAEEALRTSEARLSEAMKIAKLGYWEYDVADNVFIFNDQFYSVYRTSAEQVGGYRVSPSRYAELFLHLDDASGLNEEIRRAIETTDPNFKRETEHSFFYGDGNIGHVSVRYFVVKDSQGRTVKTYGVNQDITDRKQVEQEIESMAKFPSEDPYPVFRVSYDGTVMYANSASTEFLINKNTGINQPVPLQWQRLVKNVLASETVKRFEVKHKARILAFQVVPVIDSGYVNFYGADITERKKAEDRLREYQNKLKALASERLIAEERERQRIAIGLHDEICQKLVLSKFMLESSIKSLSDTNLSKSLRIISGAIGETIQRAEWLTFELSNPILREFGLVAAMERYLDEEIQQKYGILYDIKSDKQLGTLQDDIKTFLFRIAKELLTNVVKHAQASKISVSVRKHNQNIYVRIKDNGVGFIVADVSSRSHEKIHFGLFSVREQLDHLGGSLNIESEPGRGTTAIVVVPLKEGTLG